MPNATIERRIMIMFNNFNIAFVMGKQSALDGLTRCSEDIVLPAVMLMLCIFAIASRRMDGILEM